MADKKIDVQNKVQLFNDKKIRSVWDSEEEQWYFYVIDVIAVLTDSLNPRDYWFKMKKRVHSEDGIELSTICRQLKMQAPDGKMRRKSDFFKKCKRNWHPTVTVRRRKR